MRYGQTYVIQTTYRTQGRPEAASVKLCRFSRKLGHTYLRSYFNANVCLFSTFINFSRNVKDKCWRHILGGGNGRFCTGVFCQNLGATFTRRRRLWIWIYLWISTENMWIWMGNFISTASLHNFLGGCNITFAKMLRRISVVYSLQAMYVINYVIKNLCSVV